MAGHDLKEGQFDSRYVMDDELWSALACLFSSKSKNSSTYKFGFLKAIMDNLYNVDGNTRLTFDQIFEKFGEIYWNLVLKYDLRQSAVTSDKRKTSLEYILFDIAEKYKVDRNIPYESLSSEIMEEITYRVKRKCKRYVIGAVYEDTNHLFYSFSKNEGWIQINPRMYDFICKHKIIIEKINYYEWARFLEKVNEGPQTTFLLNKVEISTKRNDLTKYRTILWEVFEGRNCFYCEKPLLPSKIDVDHFIPWSFIKNDHLWNMVLTCPSCNRKKKDHLPEGKFLTALVERNQKITIEVQSPDMSHYESETLCKIYEWARVNGYDKIWKPDKFYSHSEIE